MVNILIGCTGSVATIKLPQLLNDLFILFDQKKVPIGLRVVTTESAKHFFDDKEIPERVDIFSDSDEWNAWQKRGDDVLHIELAKWADLFLIAPLDANSLAKIANGICDNLLLCAVRAWDLKKPLIFCPAMNTKMYQHPITRTQLDTLKSWGYIEIPVIEKTLICGETGLGAMAEISTIIEIVTRIIL
ncbi:unnamed protein product [Ceutorhynchus assimilis]|uniref:Phosphopantothenoylcysteine decarboxylase n=1 Tax=Ceutorhynchus assimilis TaxID=467358 RepID=A0A9P0GQ86_9CUCU|nr:unnamed protein product [Ceutorhynchus assimilis]